MVTADQVQIAALGLLVIVLLVALVRAYVMLYRLRSRYRGVEDADKEAERIRSQAEEQAQWKASLSAEIVTLQETKDRLETEVAALEESLEDMSFGVYNPHFDYETPEDYKAALEDVIEKQREMIRSGKAAHFAVQWTVGGSKLEGERMQRQYTKLMLRAFNGETEAAVAKVAWNNVLTMGKRIEKSFTAINQLGEVMKVSITPAYMLLKLNELQLGHELEEKEHKVLEEQRKAREQLREQERQQREIEAVAAHAEEEEGRVAELVEKARLDAAKAVGEEHKRLTSMILELEAQLTQARQKKERAKALAELTKAGYVYVLSNIGSFGKNVFKIGMTRRVDPMERVRELGDASVPFKFDVHAMVYSDDAVAIESAFHERFSDRNVNLINLRKEFFQVTLEELRAFATERGFKIAFTQLPEAREYRETLAQRQGSGAEVMHPEDHRRDVTSPTPKIRNVSVLGSQGLPPPGVLH